MEQLKNTKTIIFIVIAVVILFVVIKFGKSIFGKGGIFDSLGETLKNAGSAVKTISAPLGSADNLDKQRATADAALASMSKYGANNGIAPDSVAMGAANQIHDLFNTFYTVDIFSVVSDTTISGADTIKVLQALINGKKGADIAKIILAYGTRTLPVRTGSVNGLLYNDTYGTLRDHAAKFTDPKVKDGGKNAREKMLAYIDKIITDYLS